MGCQPYTRCARAILLALLCAPLLSGCYAGVAAVAIGIAAALDDSGSSETNQPPSLATVAARRVTSEHVSVDYCVRDDSDAPLSIVALSALKNCSVKVCREGDGSLFTTSPAPHQYTKLAMVPPS